MFLDILKKTPLGFAVSPLKRGDLGGCLDEEKILAAITIWSIEILISSAIWLWNSKLQQPGKLCKKLKTLQRVHVVLVRTEGRFTYYYYVQPDNRNMEEEEMAKQTIEDWEERKWKVADWTLLPIQTFSKGSYCYLILWDLMK